MSEQFSLFEAPRPAPRVPAGEVQIRKTNRPHECVICGGKVMRGIRAEVWPDGPAHVECGIRERGARE